MKKKLIILGISFFFSVCVFSQTDKKTITAAPTLGTMSLPADTTSEQYKEAKKKTPELKENDKNTNSQENTTNSNTPQLQNTGTPKKEE